jgi:chromosome segregation ATPase
MSQEAAMRKNVLTVLVATLLAAALMPMNAMASEGSIDGDFAAAKAAVEQAKANLDEKTATLESLKQKFPSLSADLETAKSAMDDAEAKMAAVETELNNAKNEYITENNDKIKLKRAIDAIEGYISNYNQEINKAKRDLDNIEINNLIINSDDNKLITIYNNEIESYEKLIKNLIIDQNNLNIKYENYDNALITKYDDIEILNNLHKTKLEEFTNAKNKYEELQAIETQITDAQAAYDQASDNYSQANNEYQKLVAQQDADNDNATNDVKKDEATKDSTSSNEKQRDSATSNDKQKDTQKGKDTKNGSATDSTPKTVNNSNNGAIEEALAQQDASNGKIAASSVATASANETSINEIAALPSATIPQTSDSSPFAICANAAIAALVGTLIVALLWLRAVKSE